MTLPFVLTRGRAIAASLLLLFLAASGYLYYKYRRFSAFVSDQVGTQAEKKLKRKVRLGEVSFSPFSGITLRDACISRKPDFTKGDFFCAKKAVIRPSLSALFKNEVYFSSVKLEKPVIRMRERGGRWDFEDLLALLPDTEEGLYMTWNASELIMEDAVVEADLESSGLSVSLERTDLLLEHYSSGGGNFGLEAKGRVRTTFAGKLVSAYADLDMEANFERDGLSSTKGRLIAEDISYGASSLLKFTADWKLFNILKPLPEKNYSVHASALGLLIPAQEGGARAAVAGGLKLFSSAMGRPVPKIEDIEAGAVSASFLLDDSVLTLRDITLLSNFMEMDASLSINGPEKKVDAGLKAKIGTNKLEMSAYGPMDRPAIKPLLSDTLSAKFKEALADIENSLLKKFPVTGEAP